MDVQDENIPSFNGLLFLRSARVPEHSWEVAINRITRVAERYNEVTHDPMSHAHLKVALHILELANL